MNRLNKRLFDLFLSIILIAVTLPLQILLAILIFIELRENPFFIQVRALAYGDKHFNILKFRTIKSSLARTITQEKDVQKFLIRNFNFKLTPVASWLRKTCLDELLQIYNVLLGNMSFVGPRPLMLDELLMVKNNFDEQHSIRKALKSLPGITGVWQLSGDKDLGIDNLLGLDLFYEENKSLRFDLKILLFTTLILFRSKNSGQFLPRLFSINGNFSVSHREFFADHSRYVKDEKKNIKSYMLCLPDDWWYVNSSYNTKRENKKVKAEIKKEQLSKTFLNN